jgi:membrane associated rhomboid family serine protease
MGDSAIQIGLPCAYPVLCQWIGIALIVAFVGMLVGIVYAVIKDRKRQQTKREQRRHSRHMHANSKRHPKDTQ